MGDLDDTQQPDKRVTNDGDNQKMSNNSDSITISDIRLVGLPKLSWHQMSSKVYWKVLVDKQLVKSSSVASRDTLVWDSKFACDVKPSSSLEFEVYAKHKFGHDNFLGSIKDNVQCFLQMPGVVVRKLCQYDDRGDVHEIQTTIEFTINRSHAEDCSSDIQTTQTVSQEMEAIDEMQLSPSVFDVTAGASGIVESLDNITQQIDSAAFLWEPLLDKIKQVTMIVDGIAEIHPYVKMAWTVLSAAQKIVLAQKDRDDSIIKLMEAMNRAYAFVQEAEPLRKIEFHREVITLLSQQTLECAYFIRDYARNKSFWLRTMKYLISDVNAKIQQYVSKFQELQSVLEGISTIHTGITVIRMLDQVDHLTTEIELNDMPYADGAGFQTGKGCLAGTRKEIMENICDWANSEGDDVPRICLLSGVAGSGKSAIANTIAERFDKLGRLGSSFCFDRSHLAARHPGNLFSTIARDLADLDARYRQSLWQIIQGKKALRTSGEPQTQFHKFILAPAQTITGIGPVVIVIDALDESGDSASRATLINILAENAGSLPKYFRIFITARPDDDIRQAFGTKLNIRYMTMDSIDAEATTRDISLFVEKQLSDVSGLACKWPNKEWRRLVVSQSEGLFQWASTACLFIKGQGKWGSDPCEQLECLLLSVPTNGLTRLDQLYLDILTRIFDVTSSSTMRRFQTVMGILMTAKEPLSINALRKLCSACTASVDGAVLILRPLGALLTGVSEDSLPVRPLHSSFRDFLTHPTRSATFRIDPTSHEGSLAEATYHIMKSELRFNICQLETSYISNDGVPGLSTRISEFIGGHLSYSCRYWMHHVHATVRTPAIIQGVENFTSELFLYWLEVISLIQGMSSAKRTLLLLLDWSTDDTLKTFTQDAFRFASVFGSTFSHSTPHLYISALPFTPQHSQIYKRYSSLFPNVLSISAGTACDWPSIQNVFEGHTKSITSLVFSRDGKYMISGAADRTVRVWDPLTGNTLMCPLTGHRDSITSVAISQDGGTLVSGSKDQTVRVWSMATGACVLGPLDAHEGEVTSVAISLVGDLIISGSTDGTIRLWDSQSGAPILKPCQGHKGRVNSVAISPEGAYLLSGSDDSTVRIWNARTSECVGEPLVGHQGEVTAVAYSPSGQYITSGSADQTIRTWDSQTGKALWVVSGEHKSVVTSVTFCPRGIYVLSGSKDGTVRMWDAQSGAHVSGPYEGHVGDVTTVTMSPDCHCIASGSTDSTIRMWDAQMVIHAARVDIHHGWISAITFSHDGAYLISASKTIRVWDSDTGAHVRGPFEGHTGHINSIVVSPDGKSLISGARDKTIRIWDIDTGQALTEPLEGHSGWVLSVAISPDGRWVASGSADHSVRLWATKTGTALSEPLQGHKGAVMCVAISNDGKHIASSSKDRTIRIWDAQNNTVIAVLSEGLDSAVNSIAYSPDGTQIVSGSKDSTIRIWNTTEGDVVLGPLHGHKGSVDNVAFTMDGERLVSSSEDGTIHIWDAKTGAILLGPLIVYKPGSFAISVCPKGKRVASTSPDRTIRIWDIDVQDSSRTTSTVTPGDDVPVAPLTFGNDSRIDNGWVYGPNSELLFWVPPWVQPGLWRPRNTVVIAKSSTKLDLSRQVHGNSWQKCRKV
ncbi:WD40-repeat-containing domain protein [Hygrophoropsis aurantiaca]|uniref:WD40-repeat-containing domain protein n=1 Tax=Hygrophoropsis aurantiaca TaxID=72124 RepID=A0ACB8AJY8_9AGAM|nr:WD40-repeat-containing domain protein [Hygrophoropsis aurantiaca]